MFMLIVGSWYKKDEQAFRMGMWYSLTGFASVVSPLINYGLGHVNAALSPWKYMYIFAGSLTTFWGIVLLVLLPPDPIRARGFNDRQRYILVARLRVNNAGVRNTQFKKAQAIELATDVKFWLIFLIALLSMIMNGPISTFIPTIIHGFGYNTLDSLLLVMPAGAIAGSLMLLMGWLSYRFSKYNIRTWLIFGTQCVTILASSLLWKLDRSDKGGLLYAVYTLSVYGSGYAVLMGLCIANTGGYTKRALTSSGLYVGYCFGNFIGPLVFLESEAPVYNTGFTVTTITASIAALLVLVYRFVCIVDNRKRDKSGTAEAFDHAFEDPTDKANKQFRYVM
ncbi:hypothetical protein M409DRAFT_16659 [Zasmidium cellare ATCC 36951]|uniref:Major facilitator superfamily (MFS) profile domain-containing protein n=1 Tax=Zasmidium cellare ATCC 36951 TaxID=1080233 RepID=A0A6A6D2P8_ZASCE|nr:uncharacterized protein M409DRAFT_16659 [Zasmidium cellare ATCC 36951]KAF2172698.1 hypothetical protein M409DRAFT_16659 [Zasmidium cellare ATCC 36951]